MGKRSTDCLDAAHRSTSTGMDISSDSSVSPLFSHLVSQFSPFPSLCLLFPYTLVLGFLLCSPSHAATILDLALRPARVTDHRFGASSTYVYMYKVREGKPTRLSRGPAEGRPGSSEM